MSGSIYLCDECKGKGFYKIHNAYNSNDITEVICEYCDGDGCLGVDSGSYLEKENHKDEWN